MTRTCQAELVTLSRYLEGDLTPRKARALEQHLAACSCCATLADSLRDAIARCRSAEVRRIPADVRARARERVRALVAGRLDPTPTPTSTPAPAVSPARRRSTP
jgi:anti-sigma factor RsiW